MESTLGEAKSLFWNILDVSPCGSIFYRDHTLSPSSKSLRMNILDEIMKKISRRRYGVQWKINAGKMLKSWKLSLTELKLDLR